MGSNVVTVRSRCAACGALLQPLDLVPLLSGLFLRGKCRHCGLVIPRHLFWVEVLAVLVACVAVFCATNPMQMGFAAAWMWVLLALALADAKTWRLPDSLNMSLFVLGVGLGMSEPDAAVINVIGSACIGVGVFWLIRLAYSHFRHREGLGMGDVKLMAGIGAALPVTALPIVTLVAALAALGLAVLLPGIQKTRNGAAALPFGAFLAAAAAVVWIGLNSW